MVRVTFAVVNLLSLLAAVIVVAPCFVIYIRQFRKEKSDG